MKTLSARGILFLVGWLPILRFRPSMGETDDVGRLFLHIVPLSML
ncbi:MAG: hypothetical protein OEM01_01890 [Desulfobulbaceae bacterium]|nr:hypothetical protein [Desulfobulbaceae bacterium]